MTTRRDLIKKAAVAGGVVWAAPVLQSGAAWAQSTQDNCACTNGFIIYTKYSGNSDNSGSEPNMNQCLDPVANVVSVSFSCLSYNNIVKVGNVTTSTRQARLNFGTNVWLMKTAIKATDDCYVITCSTSFETVKKHHKDDDENVGVIQPVASTPIFTFNSLAEPGTPGGGTCGHGGAADGGCTQVKNVLYDTTALGDTGGGADPLNYIELLLCLPGTSKPPYCPPPGGGPN